MLKDISECFSNFIEKLRVHYHYHSSVSPTAHDSGAQLSPHPGGFFSPGRPLPPGESTAYTCDGHVIKIVTLQNVSWKYKQGFYIYEKKINRKGAFCLGYFCLCKYLLIKSRVARFTELLATGWGNTALILDTGLCRPWWDILWLEWMYSLFSIFWL